MVHAERTMSLAVISLLALLAFSDAQSGTESCGQDITQRHEFFAIKFFSYCGTRLTNGGTSEPVRHSEYFADCAAACVEQGITCGGFAYDRSSHYGEANCYLIQAPIAPWQISTPEENAWFDSAIVDNSSLPLTRRDCESYGANDVYNDMILFCNYGMDSSVANGYQMMMNSDFASSLADCVDLCRNYNEGECQAVAWDASMVYGYQNCIMKGAYYPDLTADVSWDSATLVGTQSYEPPPDDLSSSSSTSAIQESATAVPTQSSGTITVSHSSYRLSKGAIAGAAIGAVTAFAIIVIAVVFLWVRSHRHDKAPDSSRGLTVPEIVHTVPDESFPMTSKAATATEETRDLPPPSYTLRDPNTTIN